HRAGVVHRDVKPGNVLMGEDGRVVLTDFGLATVPGDPNVTRTGLVLGSPAYIAPERARDGTAGPAADLWSLGATLYAAVERPSLPSGPGGPPVLPGPSPAVPGPRPPAARPTSPPAGGRAPVYVPGKATVGPAAAQPPKRPPVETPTRVDGPKVDAPRLDAT